MDNFKMKNGKMLKASNDNYATLEGVEYESLFNKLSKIEESKEKSKEEVKEESNIKDLRTTGKATQEELLKDQIKKKKDNTSVVLVPGSMMDYESDMFAPYPQSNIPFSKGIPWS